MNSLQLKFEAIGTQWTIDVGSDGDFQSLDLLEKTIKKRIDTFDKTYSRFRVDSFVTTLSQKTGEFILPEDAKELLDLYEKLYKCTQGQFTPLIGDVLAQAGYDATYSLESKTLSNPSQWEEVLDYSFPKLTIKQPALLDFGAGGKGYLVDIIAKLLDDFAVPSYTIDASGDIVFKHTKNSLRVGLEHPTNPQQVIGVATISNGSLCGSAGNRRTWGKFHHIIDPQTLSSPSNILATWVTADTGLLADSLATALFLTPATKLAREFEFEYILLKHDFTIEKSAHFPGEFFYN